MAAESDRSDWSGGNTIAVRRTGTKGDPLAQIALPQRSEAVTLLCPSGKQIPARVAERGPSSLSVLITFLADVLGDDQLEGLLLELPSPRGLVRVGGNVVVEDRDLVHFSDLYSIEVLQQREFVRVKANRPVLVYVGRDRMPIQSYAVDLAGGGLLLAGPDVLEIGEDIEFQLTLASGSAPIEGEGTVVRSDVQGRRAISFTVMSDANRRRLVRFIFNVQRAERRRTIDTREQHGH
jgi:hypothetical protein